MRAIGKDMDHDTVRIGRELRSLYSLDYIRRHAWGRAICERMKITAEYILTRSRPIGASFNADWMRSLIAMHISASLPYPAYYVGPSILLFCSGNIMGTFNYQHSRLDIGRSQLMQFPRLISYWRRIFAACVVLCIKP